jgi:hypothetical protein
MILEITVNVVKTETSEQENFVKGIFFPPKIILILIILRI